VPVANNAKKIPAKEPVKLNKSKSLATETASNSDSTGSSGGYYHGN